MPGSRRNSSLAPARWKLRREAEPRGSLGVASGWLEEVHHSSFNLLHSPREGGLSGFSRFRVRGSRFKVRRWMFDVGCWMFSAPISAFCPPHFSFQHFSVSAFPPPAAPAGENSRQLAQFAANRGPAPAQSRFQPFSFCARSPISAFCFPNFRFSPGPPRRAQDQFQSPV